MAFEMNFAGNYIYIYISWEKEHNSYEKSTRPRKDAEMIGVKIHVETVQMICLPEAFRLSPSSEVFYFKK